MKKLSSPSFLNLLRIQKSSYFRKVLYSYLLVAFFLLFTFTTIVTISLGNKYKRDMLSLTRSTMQQANNINSNSLGGLFSFTTSRFLNKSAVISMLYSDTFSTKDIMEIVELMSFLKSYNTYVDSIYLINYETQYVLTEQGRESIDRFYDKDILNFLSSDIPSNYPKIFVPRITNKYSYGRETNEIKLWSLIFHSSYKGALVINVNYNRYSEIVDVSSDTSSVETIILNAKGQVLTASDSQLYGSDYSYEPLYQEVMKQRSSTGTFPYKLNNQDYIVSYITDAPLGFTYISTLKISFLGMGNSMISIILLVFIILLLTSLVLSFILSTFIYKPVKKLKTSLGEYSSPSQDYDEFTQLSSIYNNILSKNIQLEKSMQLYKKEKEATLLKRLLDPKVPLAQFNQQEYSELFYFFNKKNYIIFIVTIDSIEETFHHMDDVGLIKYSITNIVSELVEPEFNVKFIDYSVNKLVCICNCDEISEEELLRIGTTLQNFMHTYFHIHISIAFSSMIDNSDDIVTAFGEAKTALTKRFTTGFNQILFYSQVSFTSPNEQTYPYHIETDLINSLKNNNIEQAIGQISFFFETIKNYYYDQIILHILQLNSSIQRFEFINKLEIIPLDLDFDLVSLQTQTMASIITQFINRCKEIIDSLTEVKKYNSEKIRLIEEVNKIIEDNLCNPNLSVSFLADCVHLSVNYLRNIYKESTGESLSNYIIILKLNLIYKLLTESSLSILEISEQLGFTTKNYFFTFFKKHTGITPNQYRREHAIENYRKEND